MHKKILLCLLAYSLMFILGISMSKETAAAIGNNQDLAAGLMNAKIYEAVALTDGDIGAVFNINGNVEYGKLNISENNWSLTRLGTTQSTDVNAASMALDDSGNPHVVFINTSNDLIYRYFNGLVWTNGILIDSLDIGGSGRLISPDIAIDSTGKAHIVYMDSRGGHLGGEWHYRNNDLMYATNITGSFRITVRQFGDGRNTSVTHNNSREAVAPPKISLTVTDSPIGAVFYERRKTGSADVETIFNFSYRVYGATNLFLETPLLVTNTDQRTRFGLFDMESDGTNAYSLFRNQEVLYLKNGVSEINGTRLSFATAAADMFVNTVDHNELYYAAISGRVLHLYQNGTFIGPLALPIELSNTHIKVATVVTGNEQFVLYTDSNGNLQVFKYTTMIDNIAPINYAGFPKVTGATQTGFTLETQVDEYARIFYMVVDQGSPTPTSEQIVAGVNYASVTIRDSGNFSVLPNSISSRLITGLTASTNFDVYIVAKDEAGNLQNPPILINAFTLTPIPVTNVPVTGVTLDTVTASIDIGSKLQLDATVLPPNATNKDVKWSSSNEAVATVSEFGIVKGDSAGNAVITVATADGSKTATSKITVVAPIPEPDPVPEPTPIPEPTPVPEIIPAFETSINPSAPTKVEKLIIANKSTEVILDGVVKINIIAGAVTGGASRISAQVMPKDMAAPLMISATEVGLIQASEVVVLTMTGGEYEASMQVTFNYDTEKVPAGQVPSVFVYNERTKRWIYFVGQAEEGVITVTANKTFKFTTFATKPLPFMTDIDDHWCRGFIRTLVGMGVVSGYPDGKFYPNNKITRTEFVSMLKRSLNLDAKPEAAAKFKDVEDWARGAIGAVADVGLINGYVDGTFRGSNNITRAEMALILKRVIQKKYHLVNFTIRPEFVDEADYPRWASYGIKTSSEAGLMRGFPDRTFRPGSTTTRAEAVVSLYRLIVKM